ncbi:phosphotransferase family protein [Nocardia alni]|uniref:phosphotransferase family protein n=1 Tax=Nocardia alni TaxID=2815723 RepID=UPI001C22CA0B|nr:phosphotransferase [Nocardia alni]
MSPVNDPAPRDEAVVLSAKWLTAVLEDGHPGVVASGARVVERLETVATKIRFHVDYTQSAQAPAALCAKGYFNPVHTRFGRTEAEFYRLAAQELPVRTPPCVYAGIDDRTGHSVVLMHDLIAAGAQFLDPRVAYDIERAAATLDQLAALHAATWSGARPALDALFQPRLVSLSGHLSPGQLQELLNDGRAQELSAPARRAERILAAMTAMDRLRPRSPSCLVHGDLHTGNIYYLPDGSAGLIDWQVVQLGVWALDVGYHLATVLDPGDLADHESALLDHYLDRLAARGVTPPDRERAWWMYRAYLPYGLFLWSMTRAVDRPIIEHLTGRLARAVERHHSLDLLGV